MCQHLGYQPAPEGTLTPLTLTQWCISIGPMPTLINRRPDRSIPQRLHKSRRCRRSTVRPAGRASQWQSRPSRAGFSAAAGADQWPARLLSCSPVLARAPDNRPTTQRGACTQAALRVSLAALGYFSFFWMSLPVVRPLQLAMLIHYQQLFDAMRDAGDGFSFFKRGAYANRDQILLGHHARHRQIVARLRSAGRDW